MPEDTYVSLDNVSVQSETVVAAKPEQVLADEGDEEPVADEQIAPFEPLRRFLSNAILLDQLIFIIKKVYTYLVSDQNAM